MFILISKIDPKLLLLTNNIELFIFLAACFAINNPKPLPKLDSISLILVKGSNIFFLKSSLIPIPLSSIKIETLLLVLFLLDIFAEIIKLNQNYRLFLVGDGDLKPQILEKIKTLNLENSVVLLGLRNDVPELLQAMDIFLFPSLHEGFSVAFVEAQTTGIKSVISSGVPLESVLIKENTEIISLKQTPKQWAEKIIKMDVSQRKDVSDIIKQKGYDIKENAQKLQEKYIQLLHHSITQ